METRKRLIADTDDTSHPKKRLAVEHNGSPVSQLNGLSADDDPKDENLETFRKEAIFRKMRLYKRASERSEGRIADLERRKHACEAGVAALEACWAQLVDTMRNLVKPEDAPAVEADGRDLLDISTDATSSKALDEALENRVTAAQKLLTTFVQSTGKVDVPLLQDQLYRNSLKVQSECNTLRSELALLRHKLLETQEQKQQYYDDLVEVEKRTDRLQSRTVQALNPHAHSPAPPATPDAGLDAEPKPSTSTSPARSPLHVNGTDSPVIPDVLQGITDGLQEVAILRERKITELEREVAVLRDKITLLELELIQVSEEKIVESPYYKILLDHASHLQHAATESKEELSKAKEELAEVQRTRIEFEESATAASNQAVQELKLMLAKRDNENTRLREQRDQQLAELNERKHKDMVRMTSANEFKVLAQHRLDRLNILTAELARVKAQLAASAGNADLMEFFFRVQDPDASYIDDLKTRLSAAEARLGENPADQDVHVRLAEAQRELETYRSAYGSVIDMPKDARELAERLEEKEEELRVTKLRVQQHAQAEAGIYAELDKLSAAWEGMEKKLQDKVFELAAIEDKLTKAGLEKAKSENKFYATMRDKEASEIERKNISRNLEKQVKVVERMIESETSLKGQISALEREIVTCNAQIDLQRVRISDVEKEVATWEKRAAAEKMRAHTAIAAMQEKEKALDRKKTEMRKKEEFLTRTQKEAERLSSKGKTISTSSNPAKAREEDLQSEVDKCMAILKCSTCKMRMRSTVITKCMHSFCKDCVDARIHTRQRKCPACNLPFAQSDVQTLFFQ